jgi:isopentenyl-diphosphate delta-isomerase type 1
MTTTAALTPSSTAARARARAVEHDVVVLLDARGHPRGTAPKHSVHHRSTPFHLGFSCHVVDRRGRVLVTRRAAGKATWPATWTNACCGHPHPGETLRDAVTRRLREELGVTPRRMTLALPDFAYRAVMDNGVVEHELCPVVIAEIDAEPRLNLAEVDDARWTSWTSLRERACERPGELSPWAVAQIQRLEPMMSSPARWLDRHADDGACDRVAGAFQPRRRSAVATGAVEPARTGVERLLDVFLAEREEILRRLDPSVAPIADVIRTLLAAGGKRLRPAFVYWGAHSTTSADDDAICHVAAAVELLHAFALLHDDVMDRSATRRGQPSAHRTLERMHTSEQWLGDAAWFGTSAAILAGDLTFVWADEMFDRATLVEGAARRARDAFSLLRTEVMAGQYLDLRLGALPHAREADAERVALLKSARYTVTRPLQLGLALAPCDSELRVASALARYGDAVGTAFQLRDDVLGLFGDVAVTGKDPTDDLREGKRTLLFLRARDLTTSAGRRVLDASLGNAHVTDVDVRRCRAIVAESGALASIEARLSAEYARAVDALTAMPQPARAALAELASLAIERDR